MPPPPSVYRPQAAATQPKMAAPPVYHPQAAPTQPRVAAPPVYRPHAAATQLRMSAPSVYRPQTTASRAGTVAPPVYRPRVLVTQARMGQPPANQPSALLNKPRSAAPPVYMPPTEKAQAKMSAAPISQSVGHLTTATANLPHLPVGVPSNQLISPLNRTYPSKQESGALLGGTAPAKVTSAMTVQAKVFINRSRRYNKNEVISTFDYRRDGSAGGNHFVSDKLIRNIIGELVVDQTRDKAADILSTLWDNLEFRGTFTISTASTESYDDSVNSLISGISNQPSNRFDCAGSGDDHGRKIDRPVTESAMANVVGYATKLANGLRSVREDLGGIGGGVLAELYKILNWSDSEGEEDEGDEDVMFE